MQIIEPELNHTSTSTTLLDLFTNNSCPITLTKSIDNTNKDFVVLVSENGHRFFLEKDGFKEWIYRKALTGKKFGPITYKDPHTNLLVKIGCIKERGRVYVQEPGSSNGVFTHCIGCFKSADIHMLSHESHFFRSLTIGFILLNVLNTFLFDNTLLTNLNFIPLMLGAAVPIENFFRLYYCFKEFFEALYLDVFYPVDLQSHNDLMKKVTQMYIDTLKKVHMPSSTLTPTPEESYQILAP